MNLKLNITIIFITLTFNLFSQTNDLRISANVQLPKDTIESNQLILSLNNLLKDKEKPNECNNFVFSEQCVETFILLDELKNIEKSGKFKDPFFYKPYLTNITKINNIDYYLQVSYIGLSENTPMLRASFELIAHRENGLYRFSSTLVRNTSTWKTKTIKNCIFHYKYNLNKKKVSEFVKALAIYDTKLGLKNQEIEIYLSNDFQELLKIIGIEYKLDYNGKFSNNLNSYFNNRTLLIKGSQDLTFDSFDNHDLWHDRLNIVKSRKLVNKSVDEGCAYIYGGSWGISWKTIFKEFKNQVVINQNINWLDIKENPIYFKTNDFNNSVDYIINALLVKKIENEKGFSGVWEFLNCGIIEKGSENYFKVLEKLTGISKNNYNKKIEELIENEK